MPLSIIRSPSLSGTGGTPGADGAGGATPGAGGGDAARGGKGGAARLDAPAETFLGDAGNDSLAFFARSFGGNGGAGGRGGGGAAGTASTVTNRGEQLFETITTWTAAGGGGDGGRGGRGGRAETLFQDQVADLGGGFNGVSFDGRAYGGLGANGGSAGTPSSGAGDSLSELFQGPCGDPSVIRNQTIGVPGASPGLAGQGGAGGDATAAIRGLALAGGELRLNVFLLAEGGDGRFAGNGASGGSGATPAAGSDGGRGGAGGTALAELVGLQVQDVAQATITIDLRALGGDGGSGGAGGAGSFGSAFTARTDCGGAASLFSATYAANGAGGDGGGGGRATARFADASLLLGEAKDSVAIGMTVAGGEGGRGGGGVPGVGSSDVTFQGARTIVVGNAATASGDAGASPRGAIIIEEVTIALGGGDDTLRLDLRPGDRGKVTVSGNSLDGGLGLDTLTLGQVAEGPAAVVDLIAGTLRFGAGTLANTLAGFEIFVGTLRDDRFIDGAGDQRYDGNGGADRFEFRPGHGDDTVQGIGADDRLRLIGFGPALDSFEEVLAATTDTGQGALIDTGGGNSVLVQGVAAAALTADIFAFG